jgi:RNA polymerase sigma-70 factor (ECF subfamily)
VDDRDERALVERAKKGDRGAFEQLVEVQQGFVHGFLRARLLQISDADDLTQEVFLRAYVGLKRFDSSERLRPWLLGIVRNLLREHLRRCRKQKEVAWTELCCEVDRAAATQDDTYDDALDQLPKCLDALGRSARNAIDMHYSARMRLAEIGKRMHRSEGAVKLLMFRARRALKLCLSGKVD